MKRRLSAMLACSSIFALASTITAHAAAADAPTPRESVESDKLEEVVITAQRKEELLQDAPLSVDVVTSEDIQKYNIINFQDITKVVPGLQLVNAGNGYLTEASMRGVSYNEDQAVPPTVSFYLNDSPVDSNLLFQSMYDVGQIEVLRGPQGTLRGEISPSGSITVTSHRPDLQQFGGYVSGSIGSLQDTNLQGALNFPIVQDKFAIRVAGTRSEDSVNGVDSLVNPASPNELTDAGRISMRFAPTDDINAVLTYQHLIHNQHSYATELVGSGAPGPTPPAGFNGPPISESQRLTVDPAPNYINQQIDDVEALIDWNIGGQKLSYVGSYDRLHLRSLASSDGNDLIPGYDYDDLTNTKEQQWSQELRLSSVERLFGRFDYTVGAFYNKQLVAGYSYSPSSFLTGAFGPPGNQVLGPPNNAFTLYTDVLTPSHVAEYAGYGSLTFHLDNQTEVTGGIRYSTEQRDFDTEIVFPPTHIIALPPSVNSLCGASIAALANNDIFPGVVGAPYPGYCSSSYVRPTDNEQSYHSYHPVIYNVEASHHFNDDLMAYVRVGSSFRPGNLQIGTVLGSATVPSLQPYNFPGPEKSTTYEGGVKWEFLNHRVLFDIDYYHQVYKGLFFTTPEFYFLSVSSVPNTPPAVSANSVTLNVPAKVDGIELNTSARITPHWNVTGVLSWTNGHLSDATIPCSPPVSGVPTVAYFQAHNEQIFSCRSSTSTSTFPRWNFNIQSQYDQPINSNLNAFIRGLLYYYPSNPFSSPPYVVPAYATLDLYLGLRNPGSQWEASLYGKNLTNDQTVTSLGFSDAVSGSLAALAGTSSGYYTTAHTPRREYGLTFRYAFGSR
jgi:iron complex outermembrane receptor protein